MARLILLLSLLIGSLTWADDTATPAKPNFVIGVWFQPSSSFSMWKARSINTLVGYESESNHTSITDWSQSASDKELFMIRQPNPNLAADLREPFLLGWLQSDEPDIHNIPPQPLIDNYRLWKGTNPNMPVLLNLSGGNVMFKKTSQSTYMEYLKAGDWIGNDFYPVTGWNHPDWLSKVGETVEVLRNWSGGKPQFAFIECSDQRLEWIKNGRGPTPGEMRAQIWDAVIHGVKGIVYFPEQFNPFVFDGMGQAMSLEVARQNRKLAAVADIISQPMNPPDVKPTVHAPLEIGWRKASDGKIYLIVLNLSPDPQRGQPVKIAGYAGKKARLPNERNRSLNVYETGFIDDFDAFEHHVYQLGGE